MRRLLSGLASASLVFAVAACNCATSPVSTESPNASAPSAPGDNSVPSAESAIGSQEFALGEPIRHRNLTIFPVLSRTPRTEDRFVTLDEGLKAGTVEVRERGAAGRLLLSGHRASEEVHDVIDYAAALEARHSEESTISLSQSFNADDELGEQAEVNRVTIVNRSDKPLYLMPGEVIVGGLQDRTIAEETIIPATGEPVSIDVYCVEQGRWNSQSNATAMMLGGMIDESEDVVGSVEVEAAKAGGGEFFAVPGLLNKSGRVAAQAMQGQSTVWDQVAKANSESGVHSESSAYTANFFDKRVADQLQDYIDVIAAGMSWHERVVGVVVAVNGRIESAEVFESTPLFLKLWPRLLRSYALDAVHLAEGADTDKAASTENASAFLASILEEQKLPTDGEKRGLIVSKHDTDGRISFSAQDASFSAMGGGPVHAAGFSK